MRCEFVGQRKFNLIMVISFAFLTYLVSNLHAQEAKKAGVPVEINADQLEYLKAESSVLAKGNVIVVREGMTLTCDQLQYDRDTGIGVADGNVVLKNLQGRIESKHMEFDFNTKTGDFFDAKIFANPYYGAGDKISKVGENHMVMTNGYMTTSDFDKPEYRLKTKKIDVYPGDKMVARRMKLMVGNTPIAYMPRMTQDLSGKKPFVTYVPGYTKKWGGFLLTSWFFYLNDNLHVTLHTDYRERKDFASGGDIKYNTVHFGEGLMRTYYMYERDLGSKQHLIGRPRTHPTPEKERFKGEWRHKWDIDAGTNAILQYYKVSDIDFLRDYYRLEYKEEDFPETYFLLTRLFAAGTLSFRAEGRVNHFLTAVERLPEVSYDLPSKKLGDTGFLLSHKTTYSNLSQKYPAPTENRNETMRVDTNNELSYPMKLGFIELRPFVGGEQTYYSKTIRKEDYGTVRGIFHTGANVSTKFYKIYDFQTNFWRLNINRLRHVITPTIDYWYQHDPTYESSTFYGMDGVDGRSRAHNINFGLENKLQTKRDKESVDLLRLLFDSDFLLKEDFGKGGFNNVDSKLEVTPFKWFSLIVDSRYSTINDKVETINFDTVINDLHDKWSLTVSKRLNFAVDDQITTLVAYHPNKKWDFRFLQRYDLDTGTLKEQEYGITRDLHTWQMSINYNQTRSEGSEIWLIMTLKAFPDMEINFGRAFNRRKIGSQASDYGP